MTYADIHVDLERCENSITWYEEHAQHASDFFSEIAGQDRLEKLRCNRAKLLDMLHYERDREKREYGVIEYSGMMGRI